MRSLPSRSSSRADAPSGWGKRRSRSPAGEARRAWLRAGVRDAGPLALAGIVADGGSFLVTVVLARALGPRGYGALNQLIGIFFVVSTPGTDLLVAVVRRVATR